MTIRALIAGLLLKLARIINPPRIEGVFIVDTAGHVWRA
jgi:hypothetical protein